MNLDIQHDEDAQQFTALLEKEDIGELAYALPDEETIDFQHTYIEEEHRNKGYAEKLIKHGIDYAVSKGLEVRASCPAVAKYLERNPL
ncbi:GNAT family N-acetyltransferase [Rufibacter roseolus]|uniref:GNAT family N-acetyltransferase n=1 Tax=Rufibacter roseolus TaxID=2817375 RepID=UPI001B317E17|nr:GNAT family N-acetyltransferase [Rufibacter roseolus]